MSVLLLFLHDTKGILEHMIPFELIIMFVMKNMNVTYWMKWVWILNGSIYNKIESSRLSTTNIIDVYNHTIIVLHNNLQLECL